MDHPARPLDSAFPPFKAEHRYKGVYERAGFDVYKPPKSANDTGSVHSGRSRRKNSDRTTTPPKSSSTSPTSAKSSPMISSYSKNASTSSMATPASTAGDLTFKNPYRVPTSAKSTTFVDKNAPYPVSPPTRPYSESHNLEHSNNYTYLSKTEHHDSTSSIAQEMANSTTIDERQEFVIHQNVAPEEEFDFRPSPRSYGLDNANKNYKNLKLDLDHRSETNPDIDDIDNLSESENDLADSMSRKENSFEDTRETTMDDYNTTSGSEVGSGSALGSLHLNNNSIDKQIPSAFDENADIPQTLTGLQIHLSSPDEEQFCVSQQNDPVPHSAPAMDQYEMTGHREFPEQHYTAGYAQPFQQRPPIPPQHRVHHNHAAVPQQPMYYSNHQPRSPIMQQFPQQQPMSGQRHDLRYDPRGNRSRGHIQTAKQSPNLDHAHQAVPKIKIQTSTEVDAEQKYAADRLSSALDDFKKDVESHKNYTPRTSSVPSISTPPALPMSSPSEIGLARFRTTIGSDMFIPPQIKEECPYPESPEFEEVALANANVNTNDDFNSFLNTATENNDRGNRRSALSMVSSIISKETMYIEEEDEVEKELQRQLNNLKVNGSLKTPSENGDNAETFSQNETEEPLVAPDGQIVHQPVYVSPAMPSFEITAPDQIQNLDISTEESIQYAKSDITQDKTEDFEYLSTDVTFESVKPLSVHHANNPAVLSAPSSPVKQPTKKGVTFGDDVPSMIPSFEVEDVDEEDVSQEISEEEVVMPLVPKNHKVEEELQHLNFKIPETQQSPLVFMTQTQEPIDNDEIAAAIGVVEEKSTIQHAPGEGPCRTCHQVIVSNAKGLQKSIHSKTGELSGQWHRSCFSCFQDGCDIQFNKNVPCYAFDDKPYCFTHYHQLNNSVCTYCNLGIEGECIENELEQKWHLECLTCQHCNKGIRSDYYLINGSIFCEEDATRIMNGEGLYDADGNLKKSGLSKEDRIERRRTRLFFVD